MKRRQYLKYGSLVGTAAFAGCTGDGSSGTDAQTESSNAQTESNNGGSTQTSEQVDLASSLTVYTNIPMSELGSAYYSEYDVQVDSVSLGGPTPYTRYISEHASDRYVVDVITGLNTSAGTAFANDDPQRIDLSQDTIDNIYHREGMIDQWEEAYGEGSHYKLVPIQSKLGSFVYNTNTVDSPPETLMDIANSKWENRMTFPPYEFDNMYYHIEQLEGEETARQWARDVDALNPSYTRGSGTNVQKVVNGEADLCASVFAQYAAPYLEEGAPISVQFPKNMRLSSTCMHVPGQVPNADTAKHFVKYATSEAGQKIVQQLGGGTNPAHKDFGYGQEDLQEIFANTEFDSVIPTVFSPEESARFAQIIKEETGVDA